MESGEDAARAAIREAFEETGCRVVHTVQVALERCSTQGPRPDGYRYPYPISFQAFYASVVEEMVPYTPNAECGLPQIVDISDTAVLGSLPRSFHGDIILHAHAMLVGLGLLEAQEKAEPGGG